MVDLGGYVIILVETKDKKNKLYGSPADRADLEIADEILEVNGRTLTDATHAEIISHIHQCIRSRTICLRVKRRSGNKLAADLCESNIVQDAFVIAVEQRARDRLQRLSALRRIKPVDMTQLSQQLLDSERSVDRETGTGAYSGLIESQSVFVTSVPTLSNGHKSSSTTGTASAKYSSAPSTVECGEQSSAGALDISAEFELHRPASPVIARRHSVRTSTVTSSTRRPISASDRGVTSARRQPISVHGRSASATRPPSSQPIGACEQRSVTSLRRRPISAYDRSSSVDSECAAVVGGASGFNSASAPGGAQARSEGNLAAVAMETFKTRGVHTHGQSASPAAPTRSADALQNDMNSVRENGHRSVCTSSLSRQQRPAAVASASYLSHDDRKRSSRDSASSQKSSRVGDPSHPLQHGHQHVPRRSLTQQQQQQMDEYEAVMHELDRGPHREMAVDVPETFVARTKTPPRYPPPPRRSAASAAADTNGAAAVAVSPTAAPRTSLQHAGDTARSSIDRIRKCQDDMRREREMREQRAREHELLRSSLRGSAKLQQLQQLQQPSSLSTTTRGHYNNGYLTAADDDDLSAQSSSGATSLQPDIDVSALISALELAQQQLMSANHQQQQSQQLVHELSTARQLLATEQFGRLVAAHAAVSRLWCRQPPSSPLAHNTRQLLADVVSVVHDSGSVMGVELIDLLTSYDMEALVYTHDQIASRAAVNGGAASGGVARGGATSEADLFAEHVHQYTDPRVRVVRLEKSNEPLGATVKNDGDAVLIGRIVRGGTAEKSGLLRPGDEILEVNGIEMRGKSVDDVCDILAAMSGSLVFIILPSEEVQSVDKLKPPPQHSVMHVKAHFDYDPDDDVYLPCREIGMSFQKGDILHITSQEDADWWQATRDGDEDVTLSGLVPSLQFQSQREAARQSVLDECGDAAAGSDGVDDDELADTLPSPPTQQHHHTTVSGGGGSTLLCARRRANRKKKTKKHALFGSVGGGGGSGGGAHELDEVPVYEEVGLYYPRASHRRPVVLVGPPNIGRHELRQKLMEDTDRFAAAIPHTSRARRDGEVDGRDYHFISRQQFETDIVNRLFVEYGEYERAYYGTSVHAVRAVISSGRTCVLNVHPHSLRVLKLTDLKPFVVFIAPPPLDKLRQLLISLSAAGSQTAAGSTTQQQPTPRDEQLKAIIERARHMEDSYGHHFDAVIVNQQLRRAHEQLLHEITVLEREPQWVPVSWLRHDLAAAPGVPH